MLLKIIACARIERVASIDRYTTIKVSEGTTSLTSDMVKAFVKKNPTVIRVKVPEGITHLDKKAFGNSSFHGIKLSTTLQIIGDRAFAGTGQLRSIYIPNGVKVEGLAFLGSAIRRITVGADAQLNRNAFTSCRNLRQVNTHSRVSLGFGVFNSCDKLWCVKLGDGVTIGGSAFIGCEKLTRLILPNNSVLNAYALHGSAINVLKFGQNTTFNVRAFEDRDEPNRVRDMTLSRVPQASAALRAIYI